MFSEGHIGHAGEQMPSFSVDVADLVANFTMVTRQNRPA